MSDAIPPVPSLLTYDSIVAEVKEFSAYVEQQRNSDERVYPDEITPILKKMALLNLRPEQNSTLKTMLLQAGIQGLSIARGSGEFDKMYGKAIADVMNERRSQTSGDWRNKLSRSPINNVPISNDLNSALAIEGMFQQTLKYDAFTDRVLVSLPEANIENRPLDDDLHFHLLTTIQGNGYPQAKADHTRKAVHAVAKQNTVHVLTDKLNSLTWDRIERVDSWLQKYCYVEDSQYMRMVGRITLLQAVKRAYEPGAKADHTTVLVGKQGRRKSTLWRFLSLEHYCEFAANFTHKDGLQQMRGKWFVDLTELSALDRTTVEQVKAFITKQEDDYRKSYGYENKEYKREFVLCGTSNPAAFLKDYTGSRRWLCPEVRERIDIEGLLDDTGGSNVIDQLWAEAVAMYRHGLLHYCPDDWFSEEQEKNNERWNERDIWHDTIEDYVTGRRNPNVGTHCNEFEGGKRLWVRSASEIAEYVIGLELKNGRQEHQNRVGRILMSLGYKRATIRAGSERFTGYKLE